VDAVIVPEVQGQPGAASVLHPGVQPRQLPASTGATEVGEARSLTTRRETLIKIGAKVVTHSRYVIFQMAEVAAPRELFAGILERIHRFGVPPPLPDMRTG